MIDDSACWDKREEESTVTQTCTSRFGTVSISPSDLLQFPQGLIGYEDKDRWVLLADSSNEAVGWLQSMTDSELALAVISPRRFIPEYRFHVSSHALELIELDDLDRAFVLVVVAKTNGVLTANLKAPVIVNLDRRLGCQMVVVDDHPIQHALLPVSQHLKIA
jgi:flagellar assembly factor FliW